VQSVGVAIAEKGDIPVTLTSLGTVTSLATVTVKSQISGYLTEIHFREGQTVKKGDLLAQVDPRPYQAALNQYEGQLERDQALLDNARLDLQRYQHLIKQDSTSSQTVDTAAATVREYEGTVSTDQAQVDTQKLNLTYCQIVSPVDGRVGLRQVDVGNYVTASDASGIVVVTQTTPISVVFTLPEDSLRQVMKPLQRGVRLSVTAYDRTGTERLAEGTLETIDNQIDTTTGTVKLRALFENGDGSLFPNQFVNVTLLVDTLHDVVTVPTAAVQTGTPGTFVYRVNVDDTVSLRTITTGASADGRIAVLSGLAESDRVVVDGSDHLSDGAKISIPAAASSQEEGTKPAATKMPDKA
jgi:multidrug efflux system membrane fusion protein